MTLLEKFQKLIDTVNKKLTRQAVGKIVEIVSELDEKEELALKTYGWNPSYYAQRRDMIAYLRQEVSHKHWDSVKKFLEQNYSSLQEFLEKIQDL